MSANRDGDYQVLWPRSEKTSGLSPLAPRLDALANRTVCELWDWVFRGDEIFPILREELRARFPGIRFVEYEELGSTHGPAERELLEVLPSRLRELGVDAVISGMGC